MPSPQVIEVNDYYDKVHQDTWSRRSAGMMAGATLGAAYGAIIGTLAAFLPAALGALGVAGATAGLPLVGAVAATAGIMAAIGGLMGVAAVATVGADSAAIASGLAEKEKRETVGKLKENGALDVSANPALSIKEVPDPIRTPFKWKTAMVTVPLFAAFGALLGSNPVTAPMLATVVTGGGTLGLAASSTAAMAASAGIFGMFGAVFATHQAYYTNKVTNFYLKVLKEKLFKGKDEPAKAPEVVQEHSLQPEVALAPETPAMDEPAQGTKRFTSGKMRFSMQGLIEKTEEQGVEPAVVTR